MLIDVSGVRKHYGGLRPLRVNALQVGEADRLVLRGFDAQASEMFSLLLTGAAVPDEGRITVAGRDTRDIATDTEWLASLDVFGLVTSRAVLLDALSLEANLAMPFTLSLDPIPAGIRRTVAALADEVGLGRARLADPVQRLAAGDRVRAHLARALAVSPRVLLLEHVTAALVADEAARLGRDLAAIGQARGLAWLAMTEDDAFAGALGSASLALDAASGELRAPTRRWTEW